MYVISGSLARRGSRRSTRIYLLIPSLPPSMDVCVLKGQAVGRETGSGVARGGGYKGMYPE